MKRKIAVIFVFVAAAALFGGLVYALLVAAHVSEPAGNTVYGVTPRRVWATTTALLALAGVIIGGMVLGRSTLRFSIVSARLASVAALLAGLMAVVNGALNLALANGGPGSGNGVVGGAASVVLGMAAAVFGCIGIARYSRAGFEEGHVR